MDSTSTPTVLQLQRVRAPEAGLPITKNLHSRRGRTSRATKKRLDVLGQLVPTLSVVETPRGQNGVQCIKINDVFEETNFIEAPWPLVPITAYGKQFTCLLDTGARKSIFQPWTLKALQQDMDDSTAAIIEELPRFKSVTGASFSVNQGRFIPIRVANCELISPIFFANEPMATIADGILGYDWIHRHKASLVNGSFLKIGNTKVHFAEPGQSFPGLQSRCLLLSEGQTVQASANVDQPQKSTSLQTMETSSFDKIAIHCDSTINIMARCQQMVPVKIKTPRNGENSTLLCEPIPLQQNGVSMGNALLDSANSCLAVPVLNLNEYPVTLYENQVLGKASPISPPAAQEECLLATEHEGTDEDRQKQILDCLDITWDDLSDSEVTEFKELIQK